MSVNPPTFYSIQDILIATSIVAGDLGLANQWPLNFSKEESVSGDFNKKIEDVLKEDNNTSTNVIKPALRCDSCIGCSKPNCGVCFACKDMLQFGGQNKLKHDCVQRHCIFFVFDEPEKSPENISELVKDGKDRAVEKTDAFEVIFNTSDSDPPTGQQNDITKPESDSEIRHSQSEFISSVFSLKGLVSMLEQECSVEEDKVQVLDSFCHRPNHPVYDIFRIINFAFSTGNVEFFQSTRAWMEEAVKAVAWLLQVPVHHTFLKDTVDICHEFINFCLESLTECPEQLRDNLCLLMSNLAGHKSLGKLLINGILDMLPTIADQLREASAYMCLDGEYLDAFDNLMELILQVWPKYISQLVWFTDPVSQVSKSKRRAVGSSKDRKPEVRRPKISYMEASLLRQEIVAWRELLDSCTVSLSITHPQFCTGIWKIDQLCEGLLAKL